MSNDMACKVSNTTGTEALNTTIRAELEIENCDPPNLGFKVRLWGTKVVSILIEYL